MIPSIQFDFNFDFILIMIFVSYIIYGYFSGGHKQIRLSINLILPFMIIYYLGRYITSYLYIPLSDTVLYELIETGLNIAKNTIGMIIAYIITYILLFVGVFFLSIYARRHILNENMRAKLGVKNNYLGAAFALLNGYVLIYFIILPVFSLNLVGSEAHVTNFVLQNPPPFSRIARTAEKAVPIKGLADKAEDFQQLLSVDGIEGYYNEAIYAYQQLYMGDNDSFEEQFMEDVYEELSSDSKILLQDEYASYFPGETLSTSHYVGISRLLVTEDLDGNYLYEELLVVESEFQTEFDANKDIYDDYVISQAQYDIDVINFEYYEEFSTYEIDLEAYLSYSEDYLEEKIEAAINGDVFNLGFSESRPLMSVEKPSGYVEVTESPTIPEETQEIIDAFDFVIEFEDKLDVSELITSFGINFEDHKGLLMWYVDELDREMASTSAGDISEVIVSYKGYYETITENINDEELESKLYLAQMSIMSYDVFSLWLECTQVNIDTLELDEISLEANRCLAIVDPSTVTEYDFTDDALGLVRTLFEGESVSYIIVQFKYDYEAGSFDEHFADFEEVQGVLESTKGLVDDYDEYYKDIANSIDGNISMVIKIAISVMKYNFDVYDTLKDTPLLSALFNDAVRMCSSTARSDINLEVEVCLKTEGDGGFKELFNMRYLASEILFKAYLMVDNENEAIIYDTERMQEFLDNTNESVESNIFTAEVVEMFGDQFAFNVIDETNNYTLLEQMYDDGQISIEAMRLLADDEYELFSPEFRQRVRSLIR